VTPYPHPSQNLAIFQTRLTTDAGLTGKNYTLQCDAPVPTAGGANTGSCSDWSGVYNSQVDMEATGDVVGTVSNYLYNRLDLGALVLPAAADMFYLHPDGGTTLDLLRAFNIRSGMNIQPADIEVHPLPTPGHCGCGPIQVPLIAASTSLLYIGQRMLLVAATDLRLQDLITQPFLPPLNLPATTVPP
jgi:hypothetical protein